MIKFNSLIPELRVTNINKSIDFYLNLGFKVIYERPEDKFAFLELEENQIMIEEDLEEWKTASLEYPFGRGINISMTVKDIDTLYKQVNDKHIKLFEPLQVNEHRINDEISLDKEFLIQDPDGYLLRFTN